MRIKQKTDTCLSFGRFYLWSVSYIFPNNVIITYHFITRVINKCLKRRLIEFRKLFYIATEQ